MDNQPTNQTNKTTEIPFICVMVGKSVILLIYPPRWKELEIFLDCKI